MNSADNFNLVPKHIMTSLLESLCLIIRLNDVLFGQFSHGLAHIDIVKPTARQLYN